jgi:aldehyde:ferredoxin oxidoreductase
MAGGIMGKILRVDLSSKKIWEETFPEQYLGKYIGGDGFAARILYDEVPPGVGPLEPENVLVVSVGPLGGTATQASCNYSVAAKSPITGFTIYNSHCNGNFARMLKFSGYDAVVIRGRSDRPVFLWINEGKTEIREASSVWGKDTWQTEEALIQDLGEPKLSCMCIGPAGENQVLLAGIVTDKSHLAARGGLGAVMGSKRLKAIAAYGNQKVPIADPETFARCAREWRDENVKNPTTQNYSKYGTATLVSVAYPIGDLPINNWSRGTLEGWERLSGENIIDKMLKKHTTCPSCTVAHTKMLDLKGGLYEGECDMPEFEILGAMGSNLGITDPTVVARGGELVDRLGLDGLGASNVVAFAMECHQKDLLSREEMDGLDLRFGNHEAAFKMIEKIAARDGFGNILADGPLRAADYVGKDSYKFAVQVKGMPLTLHDHRALWGYAFQYAVGSAGPAHEGGPFGAEASGALQRFSVKGKAKVVKDGQEWRCFLNTLGVCFLGTIGVSQDLVGRTVSAATGLNISGEEACLIGRRLINLRRAFNLRHGLTPDDDTLPYRYLYDPPTEGGAKGSVVPVKPMLYDYYALMGWDLKTGKPFRNTLKELGLEDIAEDLWR